MLIYIKAIIANNMPGSYSTAPIAWSVKLETFSMQRSGGALFKSLHLFLNTKFSKDALRQEMSARAYHCLRSY